MSESTERMETESTGRGSSAVRRAIPRHYSIPTPLLRVQITEILDSVEALLPTLPTQQLQADAARLGELAQNLAQNQLLSNHPEVAVATSETVVEDKEMEAIESELSQQEEVMDEAILKQIESLREIVRALRGEVANDALSIPKPNLSEKVDAERRAQEAAAQLAPSHLGNVEVVSVSSEPSQAVANRKQMAFADYLGAITNRFPFLRNRELIISIAWQLVVCAAMVGAVALVHSMLFRTPTSSPNSTPPRKPALTLENKISQASATSSKKGPEARITDLLPPESHSAIAEKPSDSGWVRTARLPSNGTVEQNSNTKQ